MKTAATRGRSASAAVSRSTMLASVTACSGVSATAGAPSVSSLQTRTNCRCIARITSPGSDGTAKE
jgi:hypothetical protein